MFQLASENVRKLVEISRYPKQTFSLSYPVTICYGSVLESTGVLVRAMKAHGGEEVLPHTLLTSARYEDEWIASSSCRFTLGKGPEIFIEYEGEWPLVPVWTFRKTKWSLNPHWEQNHDMLSGMVPYVLIQQDRPCSCNLTMRRVRLTIVIVEKQ